MSLSALVSRLSAGKHVGLWLTNETVGPALPGFGEAVPRGHRPHRAAIVIAAGVFGLWGAPAALGANAVYWANSNANANTISFANLDGSGGGDLATTGATVSDPTGVAVDPAAGWVYWADQSANKISFANLDGSGGGDLTTTGATVSEPTGVAVDRAAGRVYWANETANKISFANLDGSGGGDLTTTGATVNDPAGVAVDPAAGRVYWANAVGNTIAFANLDGTAGGDLVTTGATVNEPAGVAVDSAAGRVYWANFNANKVSFARLDGSGGGDLTTTGATVNEPFGVAVDSAAGRIYWANYIANTISFANLDGSGGGDLTTTGATVNGPAFPALVDAPSGTGAPAVSGGSTVGSQLSCSQGSWAADLVSEFLYRAPAGFSYQWSLNSADIAGATNSSIRASTPGDYRCRVTATNHAGSAAQTSAPHAVLATLTVSVSGAGKGTVTASGVRCPGDCSDAFAAGTPVRLIARPAPGSSFAGWGGDCSETRACRLRMSADHSVSAIFVINPNTTITKAKISPATRSATFKFKALGKATGFQCALGSKKHNKPKFNKCRSPQTYKKLKPGTYTFEVRAVNSVGKDPSPAKRRFTVR